MRPIINARRARLLLSMCFLFTVVSAPGVAQESISLEEALKQGRVTVSITGTGASTGDAILVAVRRQVPESLRLTLTPGTVFASASGNIQDMVAASIRGELVGADSYRPAAEILLIDDQEHVYVIEAYCLDFHKDNPGPEDTFVLSAPDPSAARLLAAGKESSATSAAIQSALWMERDGVAASEVTSRFPASAADIATARRLLRSAEPGSQVTISGQPFRVKDDRLIDADVPGSCNTNAVLRREGRGYQVEGTAYLHRGEWVLFCNGARHTWEGRNEDINGAIAVIDSDAEDPLRFRVDRDAGYVYVGGTGTVTMPDGRVRAPDMRGAGPWDGPVGQASAPLLWAGSCWGRAPVSPRQPPCPSLPSLLHPLPVRSRGTALSRLAHARVARSAAQGRPLKKLLSASGRLLHSTHAPGSQAAIPGQLPGR